jgi:hypothetical protein
MSTEKRVYGVTYKVVFTGSAGSYEVDKSEAPVNIQQDKEEIWAKIERHVKQMDMDQFELTFECQRCGELVDVNDDDKAHFNCDCNTESPDTRI